MKLITILLICLTAVMAFGEEPKNTLTFNMGATNNYIARGTTQALNDEPTWSVGADYTLTNGLYLGIWSSTMDFGDGTDREVDFYVGYRFPIGTENADISLLHYGYLNDPTEWDMQEVKFAIQRSIVGNFSRAITVAYSPNYFNVSGQSIWAEYMLTYKLSNKISISGGFGRQFLLEDIGTYSTYNVGITYTVCPNATVDVRYSDTNKHEMGEYYFDALSVSLRVTF